MKLVCARPRKYNTTIQFGELRQEFSRLTYRLYETRRKVSQECSHSFRLALLRPNSSVKAHKHFILIKSMHFYNRRNCS